eukprot:Hpha_TRINITY_DN13641_c0_g1::TRINITY_DN13641_c0_g1_i1::g.122823::m.122823
MEQEANQVQQMLQRLGLDVRFAGVLSEHGFTTLGELKRRRGELAALVPLGPRAKMLREADAQTMSEARPPPMFPSPPTESPVVKETTAPAPVIAPSAIRAFSAALPPFLSALQVLVERLTQVERVNRQPSGAASRAKQLEAVCKKATRAIAKGANGVLSSAADELRRMREAGLIDFLEKHDPFKESLPPLPDLAPPVPPRPQRLQPLWSQILDSAQKGTWAPVPSDGDPLFSVADAQELKALREPCGSLRKAVWCSAALTQHLTGAADSALDAAGLGEWEPSHTASSGRLRRKDRWRGCRGNRSSKWGFALASLKDLPRRIAALSAESAMLHALSVASPSALRTLYDIAADPTCTVSELRSVSQAAGGLALWLHAAAAFANAAAERQRLSGGGSSRWSSQGNLGGTSPHHNARMDPQPQQPRPPPRGTGWEPPPSTPPPVKKEPPVHGLDTVLLLQSALSSLRALSSALDTSPASQPDAGDMNVEQLAQHLQREAAIAERSVTGGSRHKPQPAPAAAAGGVASKEIGKLKSDLTAAVEEGARLRQQVTELKTGIIALSEVCRLEEAAGPTERPAEEEEAKGGKPPIDLSTLDASDQQKIVKLQALQRGRRDRQEVDKKKSQKGAAEAKEESEEPPVDLGLDDAAVQAETAAALAAPGQVFIGRRVSPDVADGGQAVPATLVTPPEERMVQAKPVAQPRDRLGGTSIVSQTIHSRVVAMVQNWGEQQATQEEEQLALPAHARGAACRRCS